MGDLGTSLGGGFGSEVWTYGIGQGFGSEFKLGVMQGHNKP